jgi:hypothetical protein
MLHIGRAFALQFLGLFIEERNEASAVMLLNNIDNRFSKFITLGYFYAISDMRSKDQA